MRIWVWLLLVLVVACGTPSASERINGTWHNDLVTVTLDFENKTYEGVIMGNTYERSIEVVKEQGNAVVFLSTGEGNPVQMTAQLRDDDSLLLTAEGEPPMVLTRSQ